MRNLIYLLLAVVLIILLFARCERADAKELAELKAENSSLVKTNYLITETNDSLIAIVSTMDEKFAEIESLQLEFYQVAKQQKDSLKAIIIFNDEQVIIMLQHIDSSFIANADSVCKNLLNYRNLLLGN